MISGTIPIGSRRQGICPPTAIFGISYPPMENTTKAAKTPHCRMPGFLKPTSANTLPETDAPFSLYKQYRGIKRLNTNPYRRLQKIKYRMGVGFRFAAVMQIISMISMPAEIRSIFPFPLFAASFILTTPDKMQPPRKLRLQPSPPMLQQS